MLLTSQRFALNVVEQVVKRQGQHVGSRWTGWCFKVKCRFRESKSKIASEINHGREKAPVKSRDVRINIRFSPNMLISGTFEIPKESDKGV